MFDQAGMVRELVKWDYELRMPGQIGDVVARGVEVAMAHPRGPVYLVLPREPLSAPLAEPIAPIKPRPQAAPAHPDPRTIATLAEWIAAAERPLIITATLAGRGGAGARRIWPNAAPSRSSRTIRARSACRRAMRCISASSRARCSTDADLVIVIESDVPWIPQSAASAGRLPRRAYRRGPVLRALSDAHASRAISRCRPAPPTRWRRSIAAVEPRLQMAEARIAARRARLTERMRTRRAQLAKDSAAGTTISPEYLSRAIGEAVGEDAIIFNEYPLRPDHCAREKPGTFFALGPAGGLGWGFGAALGAKLAAPDEFVVATLGDGAYMFANPMVGHWVSAAHELPILTIVFNNSRYGAVRRATLSMFKDGVAGENDGRTLADLDPSPPFEEMARAQGAHAERVEKPADLPDALARAREVVVNERRQALLNVITPY